jgi:hypothetical protein
MVFDNTKIKRAVPDFCAKTSYSRAAEGQITWYDEDPRRRVVDAELNAVMDRILEAYGRAWPAGNR